ncbi:MAG: LOG family protein [Phycisphaera sp.]|nr:LOG family protein [Phycisphaera sp.]
MEPHLSVHDQRITEQINTLIELVGGDPGDFSGSLVREMMQTSLRLIGDGADLGEQKLITRSFKELRYALKVFRRYGDVKKISIFGSARTPSDHPDYRAAVRFAKSISEKDWMVITGAGPGIMEAGHEGAGSAKSFGVNIRLPFEAEANKVIRDDPKLVTFRYFFTRKLVFLSQAEALALFPGGFGTLDEGFEVLTMIQTGKSPLIPIVMIEPPGNDYWANFDRYIRGELLANNWISEEDLNLYHIFSDVDAAVQHVLDFYRNFHSQRYVRDRLVMRLRQPLDNNQLDALNADFADIVAEGRIEQSGPLKGEEDNLDLPRLTFLFDRYHYGRLRQLIDRINGFVG